MLTKILLTAAVIVAVLAFARARGQARPRVAEAPPYPPWVPRAVALGLLGVLATASGLWYYLRWEDDRQVVTVRVTDSRNGEAVTYRAHKGDIEGRRFRTLEGLEVRISDADRVELGPSP